MQKNIISQVKILSTKLKEMNIEVSNHMTDVDEDDSSKQIIEGQSKSQQLMRRERTF